MSRPSIEVSQMAFDELLNNGSLMLPNYNRNVVGDNVLVQNTTLLVVRSALTLVERAFRHHDVDLVSLRIR